MEEEKLNEYTEFESKYRVASDMETRFKRLAMTDCGMKNFLYVEGPDVYFVKPGTDDFKRYRKADWEPVTGRAEVTTKRKPMGAKNNVNRIEKNLRVDGNEPALVRQTIEDDGFEYNFEIWKSCHIYHNNEATLVFYCVVETTPGVKYREDHFIEIELNESTIHNHTEEEAWTLLMKYEKMLEPLGIHAQKRLRKSLFEMYRR
jgi:adenylate cyclase class IV